MNQNGLFSRCKDMLLIENLFIFQIFFNPLIFTRKYAVTA